jgi:hypothetical protein
MRGDCNPWVPVGVPIWSSILIRSASDLMAGKATAEILRRKNAAQDDKELERTYFPVNWRMRSTSAWR